MNLMIKCFFFKFIMFCLWYKSWCYCKFSVWIFFEFEDEKLIVILYIMDDVGFYSRGIKFFSLEFVLVMYIVIYIVFVS